MKKEKLSKAFKIYNAIMSEIWKLLTIILIGLLIGWLVERKSGSKLGYLIALIVATVLGLVVFFVGLIRLSNKEMKKDVQAPKEPKE